MVASATRIRDLSKQLFEIGDLDKDKLALAVLLHAMQGELSTICEHFENDPGATPAHIVARLEKEDLRLKESLAGHAAEVESANAARFEPRKGGGRGKCGTCSGTHRTEDCWSPGGAMAGRRDEVIAARANRRQERAEGGGTSTPKPAESAPQKPVAKNRLALTTEDGQRVYLTFASSEEQAATAITSAEDLNAIYEQNGHGRRDSDASSEFSMTALAEDARVSVNWNEHVRTDYEPSGTNISAPTVAG